ncbi:MAG: phospholipase A [Opitutus sp.]
MRTLWICVVWILAVSALRAAPEALLVPPSGPVQAGKPVRLTLYLNNPTTESTEFVLPAAMQAVLVSVHELRTIQVTPVAGTSALPITLGPMSFTQVTVTLPLPDTLDGNVSLRISDPESNAVMFAVQAAELVSTAPAAVQEAENASVDHPEDLDLTTEQEKVRGHIFGYDPIYAALGFHGKTTAKFQFSFKYRMFGPSGNVPEWWRELYFGYTQTSLWDLSDASRPFYDTSYKPALFYLKESFAHKPGWLSKLGLQAGIQHESNGSAGDVSRSLNTVFVTPMMTRALSRKWSVSIAPRVIAYIEKSENPRIPDYRGNVELLVKVGANQGVELSTYLRKGNDSRYGSVQLDLTWPVRKFPGVPSTIGGNLLIQYFNGWGESLRDYDIRRPDQLRFGFMLAR